MGFVNLLTELFTDSSGPSANLVVDQLDILFPFVHLVKLGLEDGNLVRKLQEVSLIMIVSSCNLLLKLLSSLCSREHI